MILLRFHFSLIIFFLLSFSSYAQNDINWLKEINGHETNFKNSLFSTTSNTIFLINAAAPVSVFATGVINKDNKQKRDGLYLASSMFVNGAIVYGMKLIIRRERPYVTNSLIVKRIDGGGYSMPSGHAASAFNTATALSLVYPKWYVIVPAYSWACLVAYGRMYQGVHYPSDVAIGAVVGAGTAWATRFVINKYFENRKFKQPAVGYSF